MDVHTDSIAVADVAKAHNAEVIDLGTIGTRRPIWIHSFGHTHVRRAPVEGACASRDLGKVSGHLPRRLKHLPKPIQDL